MDFSKFDQQVDGAALQKEADEIKKNGGTGEYKEVPFGEYTGKMEKLEVGATKDGRPMLKVMFRITEGEMKKHCVFMNRVLFGTKNDANMIASAEGWLETLEPESPITFESYSQFANLVMDIAEEIESLTYDITYDPDAFNSIEVYGVYED